MRDFRSVCRRHNKAVAKMPVTAINIRNKVFSRMMSCRKIDVRKMP